MYSNGNQEFGGSLPRNDSIEAVRGDRVTAVGRPVADAAMC